MVSSFLLFDKNLTRHVYVTTDSSLGNKTRAIWLLVLSPKQSLLGSHVVWHPATSTECCEDTKWQRVGFSPCELFMTMLKRAADPVQLLYCMGGTRRESEKQKYAN